MPAYIPWPDSVELVIHFTLAGIPCSITLAATKPGGFNASEQADLADNVNTWVNNTLRADLSTDIDCPGVTTTDKRTSTGPVITAVNSPPSLGQVAEDSIQINSAMVMSPRTPNRGRSGRGRKYVPGIPVGSLASASEFSPTGVATIATDFGTLDAAMNTNGFTWTVASEITGGVARTSALMQEVTSLVNGVAIGSRRKRGLWS